MRMCVQVRAYVCSGACVCVFRCVRMCVQCVRMCVLVRAYVGSGACVCVFRCVRMCVQVYACVCAFQGKFLARLVP